MIIVPMLLVLAFWLSYSVMVSREDINSSARENIADNKRAMRRLRRRAKKLARHGPMRRCTTIEYIDICISIDQGSIEL